MGFNSWQKLQFSHSVKGLSLCLICSDRHVKYLVPCGFHLTSRLLLDYHVKQYIHTHLEQIELDIIISILNQYQVCSLRALPIVDQTLKSFVLCFCASFENI